MRRYIVATVTACLAVAISCGGGGTGVSPIPEDPGGSTTLAGGFTPDQASPADSTVTMALGAASGNLVTIEINVTGVDDLFSADFDVSYDSNQVEFVNWSAGELLESGGNSPLYWLSAAQPGLVTVAASRAEGTSGGVDVGASQTLIHLVFRVTEVGASTVAFERATLLDAQHPPQPIPGLSWHGGTLTGN